MVKLLKDNQIIPLGKNRKIQKRKIKKSSIPEISKDKNWSIEVVLGPNDDWINNKGHEIFFNSKWKLQAKSDRTGYRLDGPKLSFTDKATNKSLENGSEPSNIIDQGYPAGAINLAGQTPIILVNDGPSMGGFINPYTVPSSAFWKLGQAKPGDIFKFIEVSVEKAQMLRAEQSLICSEESLLTFSKQETNNNEKNNQLGPIKIIDFDKNKLEEKERVKIMEKKGIKNMKIRFFN